MSKNDAAVVVLVPMGYIGKPENTDSVMDLKLRSMIGPDIKIKRKYSGLHALKSLTVFFNSKDPRFLGQFSAKTLVETLEHAAQDVEAVGAVMNTEHAVYLTFGKKPQKERANAYLMSSLSNISKEFHDVR